MTSGRFGDDITVKTARAEGAAEVRTASMTTAAGPVEIYAMQWPGEQPYAVLENSASGPTVQLRVQAQCVTSTAFGALRCDCASQIRAGVRLVATVPGAVFVYLPQEGRGWGLLSKVEVMGAMNAGLSLTEAQQAVGRPEGRLSYHRVPEILHYLDLSGPVVLLTSSAEKADAIRAAGVAVAGTAPPAS